MNAVVDWILHFLLRQNVIDNDEDSIEYCKYGIEITISSFLNVLLILLIGLIFSLVLHSVVFLLIFINMRRYTGGYHASTYIRCNMVLCISFTALCIMMKVLVSLSYYILLVLVIVIHIFGFFITILFAPLENENKPLDEETKRTNRIKSIIFSIVVFVLDLVLTLFRFKISIMIALTVLLVAILMVIKIVKEGKS